MTTIYVVVSGQRHEECYGPVFSTREKAEAYIEAQKTARTGSAGHMTRMWDHFEIEEWELDPE